MSAKIQPAADGGVEHAGVIDVLMHDAERDCVVLGMVERRPWDGSPRRLFELQEKLNAYLSFALDGEMADSYPQLMSKPLLLRLDCVTEPDARTAGMLEAVREQVGFQGIGLEVCVHGQTGCGEGCGCA